MNMTLEPCYSIPSCPQLFHSHSFCYQLFVFINVTASELFVSTNVTASELFVSTNVTACELFVFINVTASELFVFINVTAVVAGFLFQIM